MTDQPDSNTNNPNTFPSKNEVPISPQPGGDSFVVYGSVGPGAVVGRGSVTADQIAGGNLIVNGAVVDGNQGSFADLLEQVKELLIQAKAAGELLPPKADEVIEELESAKELVEKDKNPPKETLLQKLRHVADIIDDALESFDQNRSPAAVLLKAIPFLALLIKLESQIF